LIQINAAPCNARDDDCRNSTVDCDTSPPPKCPSGRFANHLNRLGEGLERLELCVILSAAPLCEVPMWTMKNRPRYDRDKLRYPSDLTDEEWSLVEPLIPPAKRGGRKREVVVREVVNGVMYVLSTGCQWRYIPKNLPPRSTVHDYLTRWNDDGTIERIHHALYVQCREALGREASPTACVIDSQSVKSAEKGGPALIRPGMMRARRSKARSDVCHEHTNR
jgi:transposase